MELTWPMKIRIAVVATVGVILIGVIGWPFAEPAEPYGIVSLKNISPQGIMAICALSFLSGFLGYSLSRPYGKEMGILAVPFGLAIWSVRSSSIANILQVNGTIEQRLELFGFLKWEGFFWLAIVGAGFAGVAVGKSLTGGKEETKSEEIKGTQKESSYLNRAIALLGSIIIAGILIMILAQDVRAFDERLGTVSAQPATGQIIFAILISFLAAGFAVKKFLNLSYVWPILATGFLTFFSTVFFAKREILEHLAGNWPPVFFANSTVSILPIEIVCFGSLGSIWGYWLAVRYNYWRKHEIRAQKG